MRILGKKVDAEMPPVGDDVVTRVRYGSGDGIASAIMRHECELAMGQAAYQINNSSDHTLSGIRDMDPTNGQTPSKDPFRDQFVLLLKEVLYEFAATTQGYAHDKRSRWAYAFNPMHDDDPERPVYATMAALRAPNFAALRIGVTGGGQVVVEIEHRKLVTPYITNDVDDPKEFPKIQKGFRQIIEQFERMAGISRHNLFNRFASKPEYRELAEQRLADARVG